MYNLTQNSQKRKQNTTKSDFFFHFSQKTLFFKKSSFIFSVKRREKIAGEGR